MLYSFKSDTQPQVTFPLYIHCNLSSKLGCSQSECNAATLEYTQTHKHTCAHTATLMLLRFPLMGPTTGGAMILCSLPRAEGVTKLARAGKPIGLPDTLGFENTQVALVAGCILQESLHTTVVKFGSISNEFRVNPWAVFRAPCLRRSRRGNSRPQLPIARTAFSHMPWQLAIASRPVNSPTAPCSCARPWKRMHALDSSCGFLIASH